MGFIAGGLALAGAAVSAYGAKKNADAVKDANNINAANEEVFLSEQKDLLANLIGEKKNKLKNIGNIFDRFEGGGAFGDTDTLKNIRKAQEDFSQLAAGDFTGFEAQLRKTIGDALVNTIGSGAPVGTFAGLAADTQMQYRQQGLQTSMAASEFLSNEANKLLGTEFGILDQEFNSQYQMGRESLNARAGYISNAAATEGIGAQAFGGVVQNLGQSALSYGMYKDNYNMQKESFALQKQSLDNQLEQIRLNAANQKSAISSFTPSSFSPTDFSAPSSLDNLNPFDIQLPSGDGDVPVDGVLPILSFSQQRYNNYQSNFGILASAGRSVVQV